MRILITGAAGFIGSHLAERLASEGHEVIGLDCWTDYYDRRLKDLNAHAIKAKGVTLLSLDLAHDDLAGAMQGVEIVVHLAAQPGISASTGFDAYVQNNIVATYRLLEVALANTSLKFFVYGSTSSVYGATAIGSEEVCPQPTSHYGVTKLAAEQLVLSYAREKKFHACSLRLFSVYGPRERPDKLFVRLIRNCLEGKEFVLFEGSEQHTRSFSFVSDIVDGIVAAIEHREKCIGEIINIGSDVEVSTGEALKTIEAITGKQLAIKKGPRRPGDQMNTHADITKARMLLGYAPKVQLAEGLEAEVAWYQETILGKL